MKATVKLDTGDEIIEKTKRDAGAASEYLLADAIVSAIKAYSALNPGTKSFEYIFIEKFHKEFGDLK